MKKLLLVSLSLLVLAAGCAHKSANVPAGDDQNEANAHKIDITAKLSIMYSEFDASKELDTKLSIGHDGKMTFSDQDDITKSGELNQDELRAIMSAFHDNNFYDISDNYLATQVVEGSSHTLFYQDEQGRGLVNFYTKGGPEEFLNIVATIKKVALPKLK